MNYSETYFELAHCYHCHLICCVYIKGQVEMVDSKDQSNAIVYCVWYVFCQHCWHKDQNMQCIELCILCCLLTLSIRRHWCLWLLHNTVYTVITSLLCNRFSIRKKFWKAETQDSSAIPPNTIYVDIVDTSPDSTKYNIFNAIYVDTVNTAKMLKKAFPELQSDWKSVEY